MSKREIIVAGASPDTGNLGVSALCHSVVANLLQHGSGIEINVLGHGSYFERKPYYVNGKPAANVIAAKNTRRFYDPSSFGNIRYAIKLGPFAGRTAKAFRRCRAMLDISGGDSFTDLYGMRRFESVAYPKRIALENGIPLFLMPQTYGPFKPGGKPRTIAQDLIRRATLVYARDKYSFEYMKELLGDDFDTEVHRQGVDVAFLLPSSGLDAIRDTGLIPERQENVEVFGINVSGLIYNNPDIAGKQYGIRIDYHQVLFEFIRHLLSNSQGDIWLVPHVLVPIGHFESDLSACMKLKSHFNSEQQRRIKVVSGEYDQCQIKSVISQCSWFVGTRMHATVGSLSMTVPTAAIAYSGKTRGVFSTAGQEDKVFDARMESTEHLLAKLICAWSMRDQTRQELIRDIPLLKQRAKAQFDDIVSRIN